VKHVILIIWISYALALTIALVRRAPRGKGKIISHGWGNRARILVIGAAGGTGRQLVQQALEQGHQVTALVRNPAKLRMEHPNLRVLKGDVLDYGSIEPAMRGQNAVLCALGHKQLFYPTTILSEGTRNIVRAMVAGGVPRLINASSLGIGNSVGRLGLLYTFVIIPLILPFYFWDKKRQEKVIEASELDWVIVRPGILNNQQARGLYRHGRHIGSFLWHVRISRADVADFMLKQLNDDTYVGSAAGVCW
jgi:uncharacterized protein YbjT (DUF2867 family)